MILGPVFFREAAAAPRRPRLYLFRGLYVATLLIIVCTAWAVLTGTQQIRNVGDMARFGGIVFQILAPLQLALLTFLAAFGVTSAVAQEKDRRTLILLLMTRLTNAELVLGKLFSAILEVLVLAFAALPLFMLLTLLGGISVGQVARVFAVTLTTIVAAGSLGSLFALWREKTFQAVSMTALALALWIGAWEAVQSEILVDQLGGIPAPALATACSPLRAVLSAAQPRAEHSAIGLANWGGVGPYILVSLAAAALLNAVCIARVRVWNPSREVRPQQQEETWQGTIWGAEHDLQNLAETTPAEKTARDSDRAQHIDSYRWKASRASREVWNNPILWREVRTRAYGRKLIVIQLAYAAMLVMVGIGLQSLTGNAVDGASSGGSIIPAAAQPLAPFFLVSLVIINALAVNSITNERDGQALDLILVSDISPLEFVFGKLGGILWVTGLMVLGPLLLAAFLGWNGSISLENLVYLLIGLVVMDVFAATLGLHCGMNYASSRAAIGISLGTVFFLFVGVVTCLMIMVSFSGSFQVQYAPFLAFILGGSIGLYAALGIRNPSPAIFWAAALLPAATFFSLVSFVLGNRELTICLVVSATYGFATAAMLVPAIYEFDFAMGRTKLAGDE